jgi:outer membrane immunogenic protein
MNKFTTSLLAGAAVLAFSSSAFAADLIVRDDFVERGVVVVSDWTGPYIGVHGGWGRGTRDACLDFVGGEDSEFTIDCDDEPFAEYDYDLEGWLVGAQAGYLFALTDNFVVGVEGAISKTNITGEVTVGPGTGTGTYEWLATGTVIAGVTIDSLMLYGEAGIAGAHFSMVGDDDTLAADCDYTAHHFGAVAGVGAAVKFDQFSVFAEYNRVWLGA